MEFQLELDSDGSVINEQDVPNYDKYTYGDMFVFTTAEGAVIRTISEDYGNDKSCCAGCTFDTYCVCPFVDMDGEPLCDTLWCRFVNMDKIMEEI